MQTAAFSLDRYAFDKVYLDLDNNVSKDISLSFDTEGRFLTKERVYDLIFTVTAFNETKSKEEPFVKVRCRGGFVFENVNLLDEIPSFFYRNSIAILFPYVRAYISMITSQANLPGVILPTMNLSSLEATLRKNTSQK